MTDDLLRQAIEAIKSGDKQRGREFIAEILKTDRGNEQAWLWLTQTDISHEQKIKSLQQVLRINPDNETAKEGLAKLQGPPKPQSGLLKPRTSKTALTPAPPPPAPEPFSPAPESFSPPPSEQAQTVEPKPGGYVATNLGPG